MPSGVTVRRASRQDMDAIAEIVRKASRTGAAVEKNTLEETFLEWAYFISSTSKVMGVVRWQATNFVACLKDLYVYPPVQRRRMGTPLLQRVEEEARALSCEVALLLAGRRPSWRATQFYRTLGYERPQGQAMAGAWREVIEEQKGSGEIVLLKRLRPSPS
jgi:N-acetylglutamate synthase-like GNAT family acetyltransferase